MNKSISAIIITLSLVLVFSQCRSKVNFKTNKKEKNLVLSKGDSTLVNIFLLNKAGEISKTSKTKKSRVGVWEEYWCNGRVKSKGKYSNCIIKTFDTVFQIYSQMEGIVTTYDAKLYTPKDSLWEYFDLKGKLIKSEYYNQGQLIYEKSKSIYNIIESQTISYPNYFIVESYDEDYNYTLSHYRYKGAISYDKATKENLIKKLYFDKDGVFIKMKK